MKWNRSNAIGLALASCALCGGHGMVELNRGEAERPCVCVLRAIFRACYRRFRECALRGTQIGTVSLECTHGPSGRHSYGRKREEFMADFCLTTRRVLTDDEYTIFRYTYLLGADCQLCASRLGLDRGDYYQMLYRIQIKLGREFADLKPYALYPVDEYFGGPVRGRKIEHPRRMRRFRPPTEERVAMTVPRRPPAAERLTLVNRMPGTAA
jgi:hypothetical protein